MPDSTEPMDPPVIARQAEEASAAWARRNAAVEDRRYDLESLARLDGQLAGHLALLRKAGGPGWARLESCTSSALPGTVFAAGVLAFEAGDDSRIQGVIEQGSGSSAAFRALQSAAAWLDEPEFAALLPGWLRSDNLQLRRLAIAACGLRRQDPGPALGAAIDSDDVYLRYQALRTAGRLKRRDLLAQVLAHLEHEHVVCRYSAARSALLMGQREALKPMGQFILGKSPFRVEAMRVALPLLDRKSALDWLKAVARDRGRARLVPIGIAIHGDPGFIPPLIRQMADPELARQAGEAFALITGVDLVEEELVGEPLAEARACAEDGDLPWPDPRRVRAWWEAHAQRFRKGLRHLAGQPVTPLHCKQLLRFGNQAQRNQAALELALMHPEARFFNTRAPGFRQLERLGGE